MAKQEKNFRPAINRHLIKFFYDPWCSLGNLGKHFKRKVLRFAELKPGERVADVGCGTGILIREGMLTYPQATFIGIDPDQDILSLAQERLWKKNFHPQLLENYAEKIDLPDENVEVVISSLAMHHLTTEAKKEALREFKRILKPFGRVIIADLGPRRILFGIQEDRKLVKDNLEGKIPLYMSEVGFREVAEIGTHFPGISIWRGFK